MPGSLACSDGQNDLESRTDWFNSVSVSVQLGRYFQICHAIISFDSLAGLLLCGFFNGLHGCCAGNVSRLTFSIGM